MAIKEYLPTSFAMRQPDLTVLPHSTQLAEDFRWGRERFLAEARTLARLERVSGDGAHPARLFHDGFAG